MKACRIIAGIYAGLCILSLLILAIGMFGWFGAERDPVAAAYAIILAMPWGLAMGVFDSPVWSAFVLIASMMINFVIIRSLCRLISRKSPPRVSGEH